VIMMEYLNEKSLFIKLESYKKTLDQLNLLKGKLEEAKGIFVKINELKKEEDTEFALWQNNIAEVEGKIRFVEKTLFEPGQ
jgi:hypothetical protein